MVVSWSKSDSPARYGRRSMSSAKMQPAAQLSTASVYDLAPKSSSGERYHLVTTWWVIFASGSENSRARPKSASFKRPSAAMSKLLGFRSCAHRGDCRVRKSYEQRISRMPAPWVCGSMFPTGAHSVKDPVAMTEFEPFHGHRHPGLDVCRLKDE